MAGGAQTRFATARAVECKMRKSGDMAVCRSVGKSVDRSVCAAADAASDVRGRVESGCMALYSEGLYSFKSDSLDTG